MKKIIQGSIITLAGLYSAGMVLAHVTVNPKVATAGYSVATVRVPNEKDVATTQIRVVVPEGVIVGGVMPIFGWTHAEKRMEPKETPVEEESGHNDDHGSKPITEITWTGGKINPGEFMEFPLSVQYSADVEKVTWKAYQTYAGGEIVPWDGSTDKGPAPVVTVSKASVPVEVKQADINGQGMKSIQTPWLSVVALVLSVVAVAMQSKKK